MASATATPEPTRIESLKDEDDEVTKLKTVIQREKAAKRKMYGYLVKIADELKTLRTESEQLINAAEYARRAWYEGGMWRGPNVLPGAYAGSGGEEDTDGNGGMAAPIPAPQPPVSLSDLFLDLVTVAAFTRCGSAIQDHGKVDLP